MILAILLIVLLCGLFGITAFAIVLLVQKIDLKTANKKLNDELSAKNKQIETVEASRITLEKEIAQNKTNIPNVIGLQYKIENKDIHDILLSIQRIVGLFQMMGCSNSREIFEQQKKIVLERLTLDIANNAIKCHDVRKLLEDSLPEMLKEFRPYATTSVQITQLEEDLIRLWDNVSKVVCDEQGNINIHKIDTMISDLYDAFC